MTMITGEQKAAYNEWRKTAEYPHDPLATFVAGVEYQKTKIQCRGYALLGSGNYLLNHSDDFHPELGVELIITLATEQDKEGGRQIGETRDNPRHLEPIRAEDMIIRIGFINESGLVALENQLAAIRKQFFEAQPAVVQQLIAALECCDRNSLYFPDFVREQVEAAMQAVKEVRL